MVIFKQQFFRRYFINIASWDNSKQKSGGVLDDRSFGSTGPVTSDVQHSQLCDVHVSHCILPIIIELLLIRVIQEKRRIERLHQAIEVGWFVFLLTIISSKCVFGI